MVKQYLNGIMVFHAIRFRFLPFHKSLNGSSVINSLISLLEVKTSKLRQLLEKYDYNLSCYPKFCQSVIKLSHSLTFPKEIIHHLLSFHQTDDHSLKQNVLQFIKWNSYEIPDDDYHYEPERDKTKWGIPLGPAPKVHVYKLHSQLQSLPLHINRYVSDTITETITQKNNKEHRKEQLRNALEEIDDNHIRYVKINQKQLI